MAWWLAVPLTLGLLYAGVVGSALLQVDVVPVLVLVSAGWCAFDSRRIQLQRYRSGISYGPLPLFLAISCIWVVGFPWYLIVRQRITQGRAALKPQVTSVAAAVPADLTCTRCQVRYPSEHYFPRPGSLCRECQACADASARKPASVL